MKKFMNVFGIVFFIAGSVGIGLIWTFYGEGRKALAADIAVITIICWIGFVLTGLLWGVHEKLTKIYNDLQNLLKKMPKPEP